MKIVLVTPPLINLNRPYPATTYLKGFLISLGKDCIQTDLSLLLALRIFSKEGLESLRAEILSRGQSNSIHFINKFEEYLGAVDLAIGILQHKKHSLVSRALKKNAFPETPRAITLNAKERIKLGEDLREMQKNLLGRGRSQRQRQFKKLDPQGSQEYATLRAANFLFDIVDVIRMHIDPHFELEKYAEQISIQYRDFSELRERLENKGTLIDRWMDDLAQEILVHKPNLVGFTIPFPGSLYGAFRIARAIKIANPHIQIAIGGGFVNTTMRKISDPAIFDYVDFITLDDGEKPLQCLIEHLDGARSKQDLLRTFYREENKICFVSNPKEHDIPQSKTGIPSYSGLSVNRYLPLINVGAPDYHLFSGTFWNKLTLAHGCYWRKCSFCDTSLDYIGRYDRSPVELTISRMKALIKETGGHGFHFVDEAAPPALLKALSKRLIEEKMEVKWCMNARFDRAFTPELTQLMAESGCVLVMGGLEVASNRLLKVINKGVDLNQATLVTKNFSDGGIFVHAYLIYGFPTQTLQEVVDSLEVVRQLFEQKCLRSATWHRFILTESSPMALNPEYFQIKISSEKPGTLSSYILKYSCPVKVDYALLSSGLKSAIRNFQRGRFIKDDIGQWFGDLHVPKTTLPTDFIRNFLDRPHPTINDSRVEIHHQ